MPFTGEDSLTGRETHRQVREKRRHPRLDVHVPIKYRETFAIPPVYRSVQARDISLGGMKFQTDSFIPRDTSLILEIHLAGRQKPVRAISRVTWMRSLAEGYRFEVGSQFVEIVPSEKSALEAFLE